MPTRGLALYAEHAAMTLHNPGSMPPDVAAAAAALRPSAPAAPTGPPATLPAPTLAPMPPSMQQALQALQPGR